MEAERCPNCAGSKTLPGVMVAGQGMGDVWLVPVGVSPFRWNSGVSLSAGFHCCLACGHVWGRLDPNQVRSFIGLNGTALGKQYLQTIIEGPYHGLPDFPEARRAGQNAAEIDALVVLGKDGEATRRYRELTGTTWDKAIAIVRRWRDIDRLKKLALFGWRPKEKAKPDEPARPVHPMQDRWLDG